MQECDVWWALRWSHRTQRRGVWPCPDFASNTLAFALQLRKITENLSQCSRKALSSLALNVIRLVDLVIAGHGLDWPSVPCRTWLSRQATRSTLGQLKYLPSCRTSGFHRTIIQQIGVATLITSPYYRYSGVSSLGMLNGSIRLVTQRTGHVARHSHIDRLG